MSQVMDAASSPQENKPQDPMVMSTSTTGNNVIQSLMELSDGFRVWHKYSIMDVLLKMDINGDSHSHQNHSRGGGGAHNSQSKLVDHSSSNIDSGIGSVSQSEASDVKSPGSTINDEIAQQNNTNSAQQQTTTTTAKKNHFGLCRVCKDKATGIHYGIRSCEGCKGFFKRSLKKHEQYVCYFSNKCNMTPKLRKKCKLCRWHSCLEAGMSFGSMKMGRIPKKELAERAQHHQHNEHDDLDYDLDDPYGHNHNDDYIPNSNDKASNHYHNNHAISMPDPRIFSIERMCAKDKENLINFLTLRNVLNMCKTHPFKVFDSAQLVSRSFFSNAYMNTFNENILFVLTLMRDKCYQQFVELRRPYDPFYRRMIRIREARPVERGPSPGIEMPVDIVWNLVERMLSEHVKTLASYIRELPGFGRMPLHDLAIIIKSRSFAAYGLRITYLFVDNDNYMMLADNVQLSRSMMIRAFGLSFVEYIFDYHERLNKLELTERELAVLCPLILSMPGLTLTDSEPLAEIHEYYKRVVLYEFSLMNRDQAFLERVNEVLGRIPENERRCLNINFGDGEDDPGAATQD